MSDANKEDGQDKAARTSQPPPSDAPPKKASRSPAKSPSAPAADPRAMDELPPDVAPMASDASVQGSMFAGQTGSTLLAESLAVPGAVGAGPLQERSRDAADQLGEEGDGRQSVHRLTQEERDQLPSQTPGIGGTFLGPTHTVAGTPNAAAAPRLQRIGAGVPLGETQPGVPPPGEQERTLDPVWVERQRRAAEGQDPERVTGASFANGVTTVRRGGGNMFRINHAHVESIEDDGDSLTIVTASGNRTVLQGEDARVVRPHLGQ